MRLGFFLSGSELETLTRRSLFSTDIERIVLTGSIRVRNADFFQSIIVLRAVVAVANALIAVLEMIRQFIV